MSRGPVGDVEREVGVHFRHLAPGGSAVRMLWRAAVLVLAALVAGCLSAEAALANPLGAQAVACPGSQLCVAVGARGEVLTSTNPTGGQMAWHAGTIAGIGGLIDLFCPSASLCLTTDGTKLAYSTDPGGGVSTWKGRSDFDPDFPVLSLACASDSFCLALAAYGIYPTTNPTRSPSAWGHIMQIESGFDPSLLSVACPSSSECIAVGNSGEILHSTTPAAGNSWSGAVYTGDPYVTDKTTLNAVSCPSVSECLAVSNSGQLVRSTNPTGPPTTSWHALTIDDRYSYLANTLTSISCPSISFCAAVDANGDAFATASPMGSAPDWHGGTIGTNVRGNAQADLTGVSCFSASLCVAVGPNELAASSDPAAGPSAWVNYDALPTVSTGAPTAVGERSAQLNGLVNPHGSRITDCRFHLVDAFGATRTLACSPHVGARDTAVAVSASVSRLDPGLGYTYYLTAANANGSIQGRNRGFTTSPVTAAEVQSALRATIAHSCLNSTLTALVRAGKCVVTFDAPAGGVLYIVWRVQHRYTFAAHYDQNGTDYGGRRTIAIRFPSSDTKELRKLPSLVKVQIIAQFEGTKTYTVTETRTFRR